jgi:hypothetical protein
MKVPRIQGIIDRRILANYRVDPAAIAPLLPPPFRPQRFAGHAIAGICLIRLRQIRPRGVPAFFGLSSENAAHRIAVEWDDGGETRRGVYIPRRDSSSRLNALAGGRLFPGVHHHASFTVRETRDHLDVSVRSDDGGSRVSIDAAVATRLPSGSVFPDLGAASAFSPPAPSVTPLPVAPTNTTASNSAPASGTSSRWPSSGSSPPSSTTARPFRKAPSRSTARC